MCKLSINEESALRGGATFDPTDTYRYHLWREWDPALPPVTFVMLNPSTADAHHDDPTIRRCLGFARSWGYGRLEVVNLFAFRATSPRTLLATPDPTGPENHHWLRLATARGHTVVAWGNAIASLSPIRLPLSTSPWRGGRGVRSCLGLTKLGHPRHPLYVRGETVPQPYRALPN